MTPPRCNHPCAPCSTSSVYRLPTPFFEAPCTVNRFNRHCFGSGAQQRGTRPSAARLLPRAAPPLCTLFLLCLLALSLGVADRRRPIGPPTCLEKIRIETKSGPTGHHQQRGFCKKTGRDMSEGGVTAGKNRSTATKTCWRRKMALTAAQTMVGSSLPPKNRLFFADIILKKQKSLI